MKKSTRNNNAYQLTSFILAIMISFILVSCGGSATDMTDPKAVKAELSNKKADLKAMQAEIEVLTATLAKLEPAKEKGAVLITTQTLTPADFYRYTQVQATVMSDDEVFVTSETGGRLLSVTAGEGDYVNRGQLIARVDLQSLSDQKAELETAMTLAKDVYDRQKRLWDQNIGSEIQYLQAKNNYDRLQNSLTTLNTQIGKANVYAPISGVVDMEYLKAGELAAPGAPIVKLFNPNKLKVTADLPESYLGKIAKGDEVKINFPALNTELNKKITLLGRTIDPSNRTFKVEVATDSQKGTLKPNLLAELSFNDYTKKDAITVPLELVQEEVSGKKFVFVVITKEGKEVAQKKYITIGEGYEGDVIIEDGLSSGDQIIIDGARTVANGDLIKNITK